MFFLKELLSVKAICVTLSLLFASILTVAQNATVLSLYDLQIANELLVTENKQISIDKEGEKKFIKIGGSIGSGEIWLDTKDFGDGKIELVARGKDIHQGSFYGIAFHAANDSTYDAVYCRPFNFRATDPDRKIHAVQYVSYPEYGWQRLRTEFNGVYEKQIENPPAPDDWVTLGVEILDGNIKVFINNATEPSLVVNKLNSRKIGKIGITGFNSDVELIRLMPAM